jgi:diaminopimelate epimerase
MMGIAFVKAHGCGNDFLIVALEEAPGDLGGVTRALCDRHRGIGADGAEWVRAGTGDHEVEARLINADGSEAEISGNGTRCVAAYWLDRHGGDQVRVKTGAGVKACRLLRRQGNRFEIEMAMGRPTVGEPTTTAGVEGLVVSMGNPHFVVVTGSFGKDWREAGERIQGSGAFPHGTNVEFVRYIGRHELECRFYERGVGETNSSGTGSCAAAVAGIRLGLVETPVQVEAPGGGQTVRWEGGEVFLTGAAEIVGSGIFYLE